MSQNKKKIFNDPVYGFITLPHEVIFHIIETPYFQRLRRIKQLGLSDYVYPGATHTRFHHTLGALHLMCMALDTLRSKGVEITHAEHEATCIAILLHDVGHGPYSHALEHSIVPITHEDISIRIMQQLNLELDGRLDLAIQIFQNQYPKRFLHQLVSSQLDVDRLDYLMRDSFYTGVSEGVISYDRIIKMLDVRNNELLIEEKGIYSIEKFLVSRRLMYWQVYLHKTVVCAEMLLLQFMKRLKHICKNNLLSIKNICSPELFYFINNDLSAEDFAQPEAISKYILLDDNDIMQCVKNALNSEDKVLGILADALYYRHLFKLNYMEEPISHQRLNAISESIRSKYNLSEEELSFVMIMDSTTNSAYNLHHEKIHLLKKDGTIEDVAQASDQLNISVLSKPVKKYFIAYPKDIRIS